MSEHLPGTGHDAPDHSDPVATEDPVAGEEATGDAATSDEQDPVGTAMRRLDGLVDRPVEEHPEVYEQVHSVLRRSLDDEGSSPP